MTNLNAPLYAIHGFDVAPLSGKLMSKKTVEKLRELVFGLGLAAFINPYAEDIRLELLQAEADFWKAHWLNTDDEDDLAEMVKENIEYWSQPVDVTALDDN